MTCTRCQNTGLTIEVREGIRYPYRCGCDQLPEDAPAQDVFQAARHAPVVHQE